MRKKFSKLLLVLLLVSVAFLNSAQPAQAGFSDWINSIFKAPEAKESFDNALKNGNISNETSTSETATNLLNYVNTSAFGAEYIAYGMSEEEKKVAEEMYGRGIMGAISDGMVAMYNPPASSQTYVADLMESAHLIPEAQAQGLGFASLDPILEGWKQFRNIAYLFFVIIFLVIGFLIMFRAKVGQAAITAQQAIPSILTALIFVTFSYAIAGLMIDLMYLVMYMMAGLFAEGPQLVEKNIFGLVGMMLTGTWGPAQQGIELMVEDLLNIGAVGEALAWLSSLAAATIIGIAILIGTFKIFLELLKAYIAVILQIVFSPILLMMGAIPGQNTFMSWIKNLAGNLILWPVVLMCLLVERMLTSPVRSMGNAELNDAFGGGFMPPFLLGQGQSAILPVLIGIGILLVIPEIMQQVKKAMGVSDGIFGDLAKSAFNKIKGGELALPVASSIGKSMGGGIRSAAHVLGDEDSALRRGMADGKVNGDVLRSTWKVLNEGYTDGDGKTRGGFKTQRKVGWDKGVQARVLVDRLSSGNLLEAETLEKSLARLAKGKDIDESNKGKEQKPSGSGMDESL